MALTFLITTVSSPTNFQVSIFGDGSTTTLNVALDLPPLNFDLKGNLPVDVLSSLPSGDTVALNADRKSITFTFTTPLSVGGSINAGVDLVFAGQ